jgi:hypothetical protein
MTEWNKMMKDFFSILPRSFYSDGLQKPADCWESFIEEKGKNSERPWCDCTVSTSEISVRLFFLFSAHFDRK